jgi:hypothetical protein
MYSSHNRAEVEEARRHRRHAEDVARVQHAHHQRGERHEQDERIHDARQQHGERRLFRVEAGGEKFHEQRRDGDADEHHDAQENHHQRRELPREIPRALVALGRDFFRERRDERRGKRALGEKIAQQVWRAKRHGKRVHRAPAAEQPRENLLAHQSEDTAAHHCEADDARRLGAEFLWIFSHARQLS